MKETDTTRPYRMKARAKAAAATHRAIIDAAVALWRDASPADITLDDIAARADVSVRTVIRRFGSKEGVFEAALQEDDPAGIQADRDRASVGDLDGVLTVLLDHYERDGEAVARTLALEDQMDFAGQMAAAGRAYHRRWCARVFEPFLPSPNAAAYRERLDAFVAATDLSLWKLLRRDLGRSRTATHRTLHRLLTGLTHRS